MAPFSNISYLLSPITVLLACFVLVALVWRAAPAQTSTRLFLGVLVSIAFWSSLILNMRTSPNIQQAYLWEKATPALFHAAFVFYYHFTIKITNAKGQKAIVLLAYLSLLVVAALTPTRLMLESMRAESYGYAPVLGSLGLGIGFIDILLMIGGGINLFKRYRIHSSYEEGNRILYLIIALALPLLGAFLDGFTNLPPLAIWCNLAFCLLCSVAILKYHLLDIRVVFRRSLVYLFISVVVAAPYILILYSLRFVNYPPSGIWWVQLLVLLLLAIVLRPLYSWAQQYVDRLFYRDRYDYLKALEQFSNQAQNVMNLDELGSQLVKLVSGAIRTRSACLLLRDEEKRGFTVAYYCGLSKKPSGVVIGNDSLIIKWMQSQDGILSIDCFYLVPQLQNISLRERENIEILEANLFVPIGIDRRKLSGIIVLGKKLSRQDYSWEDKQLLSTIGNQMSIAVENARLYEHVKQSEKVLRESEEKLRLMYESMIEGVMVTDIEGRILQVNKSAVRMHGYEDKDELIKRNITELIDITDQGKAENTIKEVLKGEKIESVEVTFLRGKTEKFPGELTISLLRDAVSKSVGFVVVSKDITEREQAKQAETNKLELERKAYTASRLASIGEMAAGIAHEINNPLTPILGFTEMLMKRDLPEDVKSDLKIIYDSTNRTVDVTRRLLTFARQSKPMRTVCNINEVIKSTLQLRTYQLKTSGIKVITELAPELPSIMADGGQLQQVFLNLIMNAEYGMTQAHGGGNLLIKTEKMDDIVRISVTDNGPGISKGNMGRLFTPFFTTKRVGEGTGLGLSVCLGIVAEHNGRIYAESEEGKGATFVVELPIVRQPEEKEAKPSESGTVEAREAVKSRILVVDDEPTIVQVLKRALTDEGYEVEATGKAKEALKMIESGKYACILLDIKMPDMSGIELYQHLDKTDKSSAKRIIFITGDAMGTDSGEFFSQTRAAYVAKPFDIEQLKKEIKSKLTPIG